MSKRGARDIVQGRWRARFPFTSASHGLAKCTAGGRVRTHGKEHDLSVLNDVERQALRDALDDEYGAWATYDQVIRDFGPERPFINIREAEARHIEALRTLFQRYELEMPENTWPGQVPRFASMRDACEAGLEAEVANAALYGRLMRSTSRQDVLEVFGNLQRASQRHLPAFRRCATRGAGRGPGRG
jgi:hypothetical protein